MTAAGAAPSPGWRAGGSTPSAAELEIDGLRPYREGSPASRIHWPTVARRGEMLERRLVAELDSAPLIVLDASAPASEEALDKAVRAAASLCVWLARHGGCAILLPGERRPIEVGHDMGAWPAVHLRLALVERGGPPASARSRPARRARSSGSPPPTCSAAPRALERLPAGARYVVTPAPPAGIRPAFEVAGCTGCLLDAGAEGGRGVSGLLGRPEPAPAGPAVARPRAGGGARARSVPAPAGGFGGAGGLRRRALGHAGGRCARRPHAAGGARRRRRGRRAGAARPRPRFRAPRVHALAAFVALVTLGLGLMAAGLPARLLAPSGWSELFDGLDRGLAGVQSVDWPYDGPDEWIRRTILLGAPFLLGIAAAVAFWPARRAAPILRFAGLVVLLLLYGTAVTEHDPGRPLLRGFGLLVLVAAWLWLPRMPRREAAARRGGGGRRRGSSSLPLAAALDGERPWWDYRAWNLFGGGKAVTFDWNHQYGPLDWPREGTTLLNVKSDRPHYWKAQVLDGFDGFRWVRTPASDTTDLRDELPTGRDRTSTGTCSSGIASWDEQIRFTVRSLSSNLLVTAGNAFEADGVDADPVRGRQRPHAGRPAREGRQLRDQNLRARSDPGPDARGRPGVSRATSCSYTAIELPARGTSAIEGVDRLGDAARSQADVGGHRACSRASAETPTPARTAPRSCCATRATRGRTAWPAA